MKRVDDYDRKNTTKIAKASVTDISKRRESKKKSISDPTGNRRIPWTGLADEELHREGGILLAWLIQAANNRRMQMKSLGAALGVTYGYLSQLRTQHRQVRHVSPEFVKNAAKFLSMPKKAILMAAGQLRPEDVYEDVSTLEGDTLSAIDTIRKDSQWKPFVPSNIKDLSVRSRLALVNAYEEATGKLLIKSRLDLGSIVEEASQRELMEWLYDFSQPLKRKDLAEELGFGEGYLAHLASGRRKTENISDDFADSVAAFLGVPRLAVLISAGRIDPEDILESEETIEAQIDRAMRFIFTDPDWGSRTPPEVHEADARTKQAYVIAYEKATGRILLPVKMKM